jgi:hypothetical protein
MCSFEANMVRNGFVTQRYRVTGEVNRAKMSKGTRMR